ncbi:MAG TPA: saccharopine dehydrogenase C-terminal domain-containing protein [Caldimonas sp.]|jgi:homospermidine synthase
MDRDQPLVDFEGRIVMVGFGSTGQGTLPLLLRHVVTRDRVRVITPEAADVEAARVAGVSTIAAALTRDNHRALLAAELRPGDLLVNLSVGVSSADLIVACRERGALYIDTSVEPWHGGYTDATLAPATRTNYALRETSLALRRPGQRLPTALLTHGANPGLASHFVKQALLDIARDNGEASDEPPADREGWARLAERLNIRVIHVAERDTQQPEPRKRPGEFVNTWSVDAFIDEALQPSELGWGSHERHFPPDGVRHESGGRAAIFLERPGASTRVRSWTPRSGPQHGFLITHAESISIAEYLTIGEATRPRYRPTVHYAYHPSDDAVLSLHELAGHNWRAPELKRVVKDELVGGRDELGVLLMGNRKGAYWFGSQLTLEEARRLCPHNSATTLQVAAGVLAGCVWAIRNPDRDVVEPDQLPHDEILALARPFLGEMIGVYTDWTPLDDREWLFSEPIDPDDPWQFVNFRVA